MESETTESDTMTIGSYALLKKVGSGAFGSVFLCKHVKTQQSYAAKLFNMKSILRPFDPDLGWPMVEQEVRILRRLNHCHTIKYEDIVFSPYGILVIMELVLGRTLFDYMPKEGGVVESFARLIFKQLLEAVDFLHKNRIVHRDIKLENVMIDRDGNVKLIDYGLAEHFPNDTPNKARTVDGNEDMMVSGLSGTRTYWPPELVKSDGLVRGDKADIWSTGIFLYSLVSGFFPFDHEDDEALFEAISSDDLSFEDTDFSQELKDLLSMILEKDPERRASLSEIMAHPWVKRDRLSVGAEPHASFYRKYPGKRIEVWDSVKQRLPQQARSCSDTFPMVSRKTGDHGRLRLSRSCGGKFVSEFTGRLPELKFPLFETSTSGSVGSSCETGYTRAGNIRKFMRNQWKKVRRVLGMKKKSVRAVGVEEQAAMINFPTNTREQAPGSAETDAESTGSGETTDACGGPANGRKMCSILHVLTWLCAKCARRTRQSDHTE